MKRPRFGKCCGCKKETDARRRDRRGRPGKKFECPRCLLVRFFTKKGKR